LTRNNPVGAREGAAVVGVDWNETGELPLAFEASEGVVAAGVDGCSGS
jgi:hypothetical protein